MGKAKRLLGHIMMKKNKIQKNLTISTAKHDFCFSFQSFLFANLYISSWLCERLISKLTSTLSVLSSGQLQVVLCIPFDGAARL